MDFSSGPLDDLRRRLTSILLSLALAVPPVEALAGERPVWTGAPGAVSDPQRSFDGNAARSYGVNAYSAANPTYAFGNMPVPDPDLSETPRYREYSPRYNSVPSPGRGADIGIGRGANDPYGKSRSVAMDMDPRTASGVVIGGIGGALLGFALGGPLGAMLGFGIGAVAAGAMAQGYVNATSRKGKG